jgi:glycosyltransferase involved in cell wall biosynthesis
LTQLPPKRVLHVVGSMNQGGVETWLMHVLRTIDRTSFHMDFLVNSATAGVYDDEVRSLGSRIIVCPGFNRPWQYALNFRRLVAEHGPYDVVHSHVHHFSGWTLLLARTMGVQTRIAHSHSDTSSVDGRSGKLRKVYLAISKALVSRSATIGLAASQEAARALFGRKWQSNPRVQILYYGIDLKPFAIPVDRDSLRLKLGIAPDDLVIGHVGRFQEVKNHAFLLQIFKEALEINPRVRLLLVGTGVLRASIESQAVAQKLSERIIFAGARSDVPQVLRAMDVFVLPSFYEGLPVAGIEAQAAGLPVLFSDTITREAAAIPAKVQHLSLGLSASTWASFAIEATKKTRVEELVNSYALLAKGPFDIEQTIDELVSLYGATGRREIKLKHAPSFSTTTRSAS